MPDINDWFYRQGTVKYTQGPLHQITAAKVDFSLISQISVWFSKKLYFGGINHSYNNRYVIGYYATTTFKEQDLCQFYKTGFHIADLPSH